MLQIIWFALLTSVAAQQTWTVGQTIKVSSGTINGQSSSWKPAVSEYLGIPFALPPVGSLRFQAPAPLKSDKLVNATSYGFSCPANIDPGKTKSIPYDGAFGATLLASLGQVEEKFDEDCLTLNVWTKPQTGEKKKAVMVWIYGGGFGSGGTNNHAYNGARLADEHDVTVVSINYRTNIFGFPRGDFLPDQNLGLLDQRVGVEWVRDNIEKFGGDPKRIILFGQSAGAASVDYYSFAWTKDPIVTGIVAQSGIASNAGGRGNAANYSAGWYKSSQSLGCGGVEAGAKTLTCMQSKSWQDIANSIEKRGVTPNLGEGGFGPVTDNKVVFSDYARRRDTGEFAKIPLLVGNTNNEGGFYALLAKSRGGGKSATGSLPTSAMNTLIGCGPHAAARSRIKAGINAWRYLYSGEYPNQNIGFPGAWHGSEIGPVFGTTELLSRKPDTKEEIELSMKLRQAWTEFAKDPVNGLVKLGWPIYDEEKSTVIRLAAPNSSEIVFEPRAKYDARCPK